MQRLPYILILLGLSIASFAQNPHGTKLKVDCNACHTSGSWSYTANEKLFTHSETGFGLDGQHAKAECKDCHTTLVFDEAENTCVACHTDVHSMSVGNDCARCHTANNWLVDEIPELHEQNGFPLVGAHRMAACTDCHTSETNLRWDRIGNDCAMCHMPDYNSAQSPNHMQSGFSTDCAMCHDVFGTDWGASGSFHFFFPLTGGHNISDCTQCHKNGNDYSGLSPDCVSCHLADYQGTTSPNHGSLGFSQNCAECHSINGWTPANLPDHDPIFPIYSGKHKGEWNECTDCHTTGSTATFSCIDCHEHSNANELANEHDDEPGYSFVSSECYRCHPKGDK